MNPLICIRGSASPGHSYPMTPLNVKNTGDSPMNVTYSANPADAMTWLKVSPAEILPGASASIPVTLVVPSNAGSGEGYVIRRRGVPTSTSGSASGLPSSRVRRGRVWPSPGNQLFGVLWLIILVVIVLVVVWIRRRLAGRL